MIILFTQKNDIIILILALNSVVNSLFLKEQSINIRNISTCIQNSLRSDFYYFNGSITNEAPLSFQRNNHLQHAR